MTIPGSVLPGTQATAGVILVVEDQDELRASVSDFFRLCGFEVLAAADAQAALQALDAGAHPDLIFTDVNMPGAMDGAQLARWMAVNRPGLPVLVTSGEECPKQLPISSSCHFVRKPYMLDALEHDIRDFLGRTPRR